MKTKRVLKKWVKVTITSILIVSALTVLISLDSNYNRKEINNCVSAGHTETYCIAHS